MNWHKSESTVKPQEVETGKTSTFIRKNIEETDNGYIYDECIIPNDDAQVYSAQLAPVVEAVKADTDYALALEGEVPQGVEKKVYYRELYQSGKWSRARIDKLYEKGLITQDEYDYILEKE